MKTIKMIKMNKFIITEEAYEYLLYRNSKFAELADTVSGLDFDWCKLPFEVRVYKPESRGCSKLGTAGVDVECSNEEGSFYFSFI